MARSQESEITWSNLGPELLDRAPRYLIYFLLFYAPFCYGLRNGVGEPFFVSVAYVAFFLHCWKCYLDDRWPRVPGWLVFCMSLIALQGLWMCLNADSYHRWHRELITVRFFLPPPPFPDLPGSRDVFASPVQFFPQLAVFCLMLIVVNQRSDKRKAILIVAAVCAVTFAIMGASMKISGEKLLRLYWDFPSWRTYLTVFGPYRYHANAATFLVMGLALVLGIVIDAKSKGRKTIYFLALMGSILIAWAIYLNTSRAGWLLSVIVLALFAPRFLIVVARDNHGEESPLKFRVTVIVSVIAITIAVAAAFAADTDYRLRKLLETSDKLSERFPLFLFLQMVGDTPLLGFGPGTFSFVFPKYQLASPELFRLDRYLNEAHQDYFQLFIDWGPLTFTAWCAILFVPLIRFALDRFDRGASALHFACFSGALVVLIHATMDFPLQITSLLFYFGLLLSGLIGTSRTAKSPGPDNHAQVDRAEA